MPDRPWTDEYTLLCEKCGYVIEGLDPSGNCPECGKPIVESLPERRVGTPWQQSPGIGSLVRTWWMTLRHPVRTLDVMQVGPESEWLVFFSILTSSTLASTGIGVASGFVLYTPVKNEGWVGYSLFATLVTLILSIPFLYVLTLTEEFGLNVLARQRDARLGTEWTRAICSHGSVGWCVSTFLGSAALMFAGWKESEPNVQLEVIWWLVVILSFFPGFLFFETFAYLGLRRLKFANRVRPPTASEGATTRVEDAL